MKHADASGVLLAGGHVVLPDLKHTGRMLTLRVLRPVDLPQVMTLQERISTNLKAEGHTSYIVPRSAETFVACMDYQGLMLGVFDGTALVAQSLLHIPPVAGSDSGCDLPTWGTPDQTLVLGGVLVDTAYRGNHLMQRMGQTALGIARARGRRYVVSEADVSNTYSWRVMLDIGLRVTACDEAPSDGAWLYMAQYDLTWPLPDSADVVMYLPETAENPVRRRLLAKGGYMGCHYHGERMGLSRRHV